MLDKDNPLRNGHETINCQEKLVIFQLETIEKTYGKYIPKQIYITETDITYQYMSNISTY